MGNFRWMQSVLPFTTQSLLEIGAGEGRLIQKLSRKFPQATITGVDLIPGPAGLHWQQGDLFNILPGRTDDVLAGVMILHHFSDDQLRQLGALAKNFRRLCFCEPWRSRAALMLGAAMSPFFNSVTRHDLPVSVAAGFRRGELARLLDLDDQWKIVESIDWRGSLRFQAIQK